jgi:hypothetical protein
VWGDANNTVELVCNRQKIKITATLTQALKSVRHTTDVKLLWADAICINQNSNEERNHQVIRMASIYENVQRVLVHLGPDPKGIADDFFQLIKETNRYFGRELPKYDSPSKMPLLSELQHHPVETDPKRWFKL